MVMLTVIENWLPLILVSWGFEKNAFFLGGGGGGGQIKAM